MTICWDSVATWGWCCSTWAGCCAETVARGRRWPRSWSRRTSSSWLRKSRPCCFVTFRVFCDLWCGNRKCAVGADSVGDESVCASDQGRRLSPRSYSLLPPPPRRRVRAGVQGLWNVSSWVLAPLSSREDRSDWLEAGLTLFFHLEREGGTERVKDVDERSNVENCKCAAFALPERERGPFSYSGLDAENKTKMLSSGQPRSLLML